MKQTWFCLFALLLSGYALTAGVASCGYSINGITVPGLIDPSGGFDMRSTLTRDGNAVISLGELRSRITISKAAWSIYSRALIADTKGYHASATGLLQDAVIVAPQFVEAHAALALSYMEDQYLESANHEIQTTLALNKSYLPGRELEGILALLRGDSGAAIVILKKVLTTGPRRASAHYFLARALREQNQCDLALDQFEMAQKLRRHPPTAITVDVTYYPPIGE